MFTSPMDNLIMNHLGGPTEMGRVNLVNQGALGGGSFDPGLSRPYLEDDGQIYVDVTTGFKVRRDVSGAPVVNGGMLQMDRIKEPQRVVDRLRHRMPVLDVTNATVLRKDQWILLDQAVGMAARQRLRAWSDLRAASTRGGIDGMATPILEHEIMTDGGEAIVDMEGIAEGRNFQPNYALQGLPLPITHADFWLPERFRAAAARQGQTPETVRGEQAARRVGEMIEKTYIGTEVGTTFGDSSAYIGTSKVYGLTNFPDRITYTSLPASSSMTGENWTDAIIAMREAAYTQGFYGPFILYISTAYDAKVDDDYKANGDKTTRQRALDIDGINAIRRLDYLTGDVMILVQMTSDVVQAINGMEVTTIQWSQKGGMQHMFKVMAIQVPLIRSVYGANQSTSRVTGIVHGTTS